jgi:catechol 2,3-dioxygenase-like lactoylglutathione lyase family enzyme
MPPHLRIARPVSDLETSTRMYQQGLSLEVLGRFSDHDGFDGVMLGDRAAGYHVELTVCRLHPVTPTPTPEDLLVFYVADSSKWSTTCAAMLRAGFVDVEPLNPWWKQRGRTFADHDGYRVVIEQSDWRPNPRG